VNLLEDYESLIWSDNIRLHLLTGCLFRIAFLWRLPMFQSLRKFKGFAKNEKRHILNGRRNLFREILKHSCLFSGEILLPWERDKFYHWKEKFQLFNTKFQFHQVYSSDKRLLLVLWYRMRFWINQSINQSINQ